VEESRELRDRRGIAWGVGEATIIWRNVAIDRIL
jgi:hypothetical protein